MKNNVNKILVLFFITLAIGFYQDNYSLSFDGEDDYVDFVSGATLNLENFTM